jgi:arylsulfatase A-like enzyme
VIDPHPPYYTNATWLAKLDQAQLNATINATRWQPWANLHPADRYQATSEGVPEQEDADLRFHLARAWHGQTAETDHMMGMVLEALRNSPAFADTFIIFTSDHVRLTFDNFEHAVHCAMLCRCCCLMF